MFKLVEGLICSDIQYLVHLYVYYFVVLYIGTGCVCCTHVTLHICFCVLVFVRSVNRAYFKCIHDQVRRCPLTEDDEGLDKVQEG